MAGNIFLFIDGIPGESTSGVFRNWIDISSFSYGTTMEIDQESRPGSGGGTSGAADPEDFSFDTKMSVASVVLLQACAMGAVIPRIKLIQCNVVNDTMLVVSDYALGDSIISSVSIDGSGGDIPSQSFSINYGSIIWRYNCYNHYNPSQLVATVEREWSVIKADPKVADPNAHRASKIANDKSFMVPDIAESDALHAYENYKDGVRVTFAPGPNVNMPPKSGQNSGQKPTVNKANSSFSKIFS